MGGMGFCDLKVFNQALLAKHIWRLHSMPNSLVHSLLKARYFKNDQVLEAYRGHGPSYSWCSLWGSKSVLLDGLKWRVSCGEKVRVWMDSWLPGKPNTIAPNHGTNFDPDLKMADLMFHKSVEWNMNVLNALFSSEDHDKN
ncbi:uncharacterized protein LOC110683691 [Chenopodium quinoa]|uniref:uncharacterized protein LOC110683691 n=1 Tax=Chenopodium quinoa TaxID=63459 RepID=UPI000B7952C6|nr:uncharacterized protein LOC110683691 [Chenopodium quinoa]